MSSSPLLAALPLTLVALAACAPAADPPPAPQPASAVALPGGGAAANGPMGTLVVLNKGEASAWLVDVASGEVVARLPTGHGPHEVAISPDGRRAVVGDYGDRGTVGQSLTLIDIPARRVTGTISFAPYRRPHGIAWMPDGRRVIATAEMDSAVVVVDTETGRVERAIRTGAAGSHMLALSADGQKVYTANIPSGTVTAMDVERGEATGTGRAGRFSEGLALSPDGAEVWVGNRDDNTVSVIDTRTLATVATLPAAQLPYRVAFTPDGRQVLVANPMSSQIRVFDRAARRESAAIVMAYPEGGQGEPLGLAVTPDGRYVFATDGKGPRVALVDLREGRVLRSYGTGAGPDGIGYSPLVVR